jgi:hypothetical protein
MLASESQDGRLNRPGMSEAQFLRGPRRASTWRSDFSGSIRVTAVGSQLNIANHGLSPFVHMGVLDSDEL